MTATNAPFLYSYHSDCLKVRATNRYILEEKDAAARCIAAVIADRPVRVAMIDLRQVPPPYTFMDRVQLGEAAGRHLSGTPLAILLLEEQMDPDRIGKVVACNRGANVEVFTVEAEAQAWAERYLIPA